VEPMGKIEGISHEIYKYDNMMLRGGDILSHSGALKLKYLGVDTVFSVTPTGLERKVCKDHNLKLIELPYEKEGVPPSVLKTFLESVQNDDRIKHVHCHSAKTEMEL